MCKCNNGWSCYTQLECNFDTRDREEIFVVSFNGEEKYRQRLEYYPTEEELVKMFTEVKLQLRNKNLKKLKDIL